jgi:hypothetical protein
MARFIPSGWNAAFVGGVVLAAVLCLPAALEVAFGCSRWAHRCVLPLQQLMVIEGSVVVLSSVVRLHRAHLAHRRIESDGKLHVYSMHKARDSARLLERDAVMEAKLMQKTHEAECIPCGSLQPGLSILSICLMLCFFLKTSDQTCDPVTRKALLLIIGLRIIGPFLVCDGVLCGAGCFALLAGGGNTVRGREPFPASTSREPVQIAGVSASDVAGDVPATPPLRLLATGLQEALLASESA